MTQGPPTAPYAPPRPPGVTPLFTAGTAVPTAPARTSVRAQSLAFKGGLFCHAASPGIVDSDLGRHVVPAWLWPFTKPLRMLLMRSPAEGALAVVGGALTPQATSCFGRYWDGEAQVEDLVIERMGHLANNSEGSPCGRVALVQVTSSWPFPW
eukprot:g1179.t1